MAVGCTESRGDGPRAAPWAAVCAASLMGPVVLSRTGAMDTRNSTAGRGTGAAPACPSATEGTGRMASVAFRRHTRLGCRHRPRHGAERGTRVYEEQAGPCCWEPQPERTDGQTDRRVRQAGRRDRGESPAGNRTGWPGGTAETRDRMAAWPWISDAQSCGWREGWLGMTDAGVALLSPAPPWCPPGPGDTSMQPRPPPTLTLPQPDAGARLRPAALAPLPLPRCGAAALPETLMGTTLVWRERDWCRCCSSTVGSGKALAQPGCFSGLVGRLSEASGGRAPSPGVLGVSSSVARRLGGCREKGM